MPARTDFSPFVVLSGTDKPALSAEDKQLCVEGLQHGHGYTVTLRAGLPSVVHETLSKSADFSIYVRDRQPSVRFSTTGYVLPRTGQNGIPLISVNTRSVAIDIYRVSDRNLIDEIEGVGYGEQRFSDHLSRYNVDHLKRLARRFGLERRMSINSSPLNQEVTTAFPIDQALGRLKPGLYVMAGAAGRAEKPD